MLDHTRADNRRDQEEGHPWDVEAAIWDPDTGDVAYILKGVKLANAIDARTIHAAQDALAVAREVVRIFGDSAGSDGDMGNLVAEAIATVAKADGGATTVQIGRSWKVSEGLAGKGTTRCIRDVDSGNLLAYMAASFCDDEEEKGIAHIMSLAPEMMRMLAILVSGGPFHTGGHWTEANNLLLKAQGGLKNGN